MKLFSFRSGNLILYCHRAWSAEFGPCIIRSGRQTMWQGFTKVCLQELLHGVSPSSMDCALTILEARLNLACSTIPNAMHEGSDLLAWDQSRTRATLLFLSPYSINELLADCRNQDSRLPRKQYLRRSMNLQNRNSKLLRRQHKR